MTKATPNYQELNDELEAVIAALQHEDLGVDEALQHYQRGLELIKQLEIYLTNAENTVRELQAKFNDAT